MNVKCSNCQYCKQKITGMFYIFENNRMCKDCHNTIKIIGGYHGRLEN